MKTLAVDNLVVVKKRCNNNINLQKFLTMSQTSKILPRKEELKLQMDSCQNLLYLK